jgi:hypothetical protein
MLGSLARLAGAILVAAAAGCTSSGPSPAPSPPVTPSTSFDGTYRGMIRLTSSSAGAGNWCDTPPAISFTLANNTFNYVLAHPNVPQDPNYSMSPSFTVTVAGDGSFDATSRNGEAEMVGRITGSQIAGRINGTACAYTFTADRS